MVVAGECVLRYDNEPGKGDHRHVGDGEISYAFSSYEKLLADFWADVDAWRPPFASNSRCERPDSRVSPPPTAAPFRESRSGPGAEHALGSKALPAIALFLRRRDRRHIVFVWVCL
ncbi:MAG: toxin-antitoxin system TumE family protein [Vicinamibacterales bacterium]